MKWTTIEEPKRVIRFLNGTKLTLTGITGISSDDTTFSLKHDKGTTIFYPNKILYMTFEGEAVL